MHLWKALLKVRGDVQGASSSQSGLDSLLVTKSSQQMSHSSIVAEWLLRRLDRDGSLLQKSRADSDSSGWTLRASSVCLVIVGVAEETVV